MKVVLQKTFQSAFELLNWNSELISFVKSTPTIGGYPDEAIERSAKLRFGSI